MMKLIRDLSARALPVNFFLFTLTNSINLLFGFFKFTNALNIRFFYLYSPKTINIAIFSPSIDFWMWAISLVFMLFEVLLMKTLNKVGLPRWTVVPYILSLASLAIFTINDRIAYLVAVPLGFVTLGLSLFYGKGYQVTSTQEATSIMFLCITALLILFEAGSIFTWAFHTLSNEAPFGLGARWRLPWIDLQLFNILYPLTSWLFLAFLYSWIWIPASKYVLTNIRTHAKHTLLTAERKVPSPNENKGLGLKLDRKFLTIGLLLSVVAATLIAYYPVTRYPSSTVVGTDSIVYYDWLKEMTQKGPTIRLEKDRPILFLLLYVINYAVGSPTCVIRIFPIILAVCLSLAVYWFVKVGTGSEQIALMSSLLSAFSFQTTIGVFAYLATNWLAVIETLLLMIFLLKSLEKHSRKYMLTSTLIGIVLLLTHPFTWDIIMAILAIYSAWTLLRKRNIKIEAAAPIFLLLTNSVFYAVYSLMPLGTGVNAAEGWILSAASGTGLSSLLNLQNSLASMVQMWVGGLLANPLMMILATAGMFPTLNLVKRFNKLTLLWVIVASAALLAAPLDLYFRIIFMIPVQIFAAIGLYWILEKLENSNAKFKTSKAFQALKIFIVALVFLFMLNYALRSVDGAVVQITAP